MAEPYKIVIGLEVHVQLLTKTKLFCGCPNHFGLPPNSATCPVCLGMPGSLPVMNRRAFDLSLKAALALNCGIASHPGEAPGFTKWDRKNYYYPDLPKNYQISQYELPFSHDGYLDINVHPDPKKGYTAKRIGIIRAHLEEDAGKNTHDETGRGGDSRVDLNRTGTPLLEIVSHPEMNSHEEAIAYLEEMRLLLRELGVSDCEMQEGSLRCDANVNIHVPFPEKKGFYVSPIVEIKNVNSFRAVGRAIAYEAKRHYEEFLKLNNPAINLWMSNYNEFVQNKVKPAKDISEFLNGIQSDRILKEPNKSKTTAGWDDAKGRTEVQRHKEEAADYRYFPEPDLVPVVVSSEQVNEVKAGMGELPQAQRTRLQSQYGLSPYDADVFVHKGREMVRYFEVVAKAVGDGKAAANRISDLVFPAMTERKEEIREFPVSANAYAEFVTKTGPLSKQDRVDLFHYVLENNVGVDAAMEKTGIKPATFDAATLLAAVKKAIEANPKAVADFKSGKDAAKMAIVGHVMKNNKGVPNEAVRKVVDEELAKG